jgi:hypothetical protein
MTGWLSRRPNIQKTGEDRPDKTALTQSAMTPPAWQDSRVRKTSKAQLGQQQEQDMCQKNQ